jgi:hypothetical protein
MNSQREKGDIRNAIVKETNQNAPKETNHIGFDIPSKEPPVIFARLKRATSIANANPT